MLCEGVPFPSARSGSYVNNNNRPVSAHRIEEKMAAVRRAIAAKHSAGCAFSGASQRLLTRIPGRAVTG